MLTLSFCTSEVARWQLNSASSCCRSRTKRQTVSQVMIGISQRLSVHLRTQVVTFNLLITGLVFMTDTNLAYWQNLDEMRLLLRIHCAVIILRWVHDCHLSILSGYRSAVWELSHAITSHLVSYRQGAVACIGASLIFYLRCDRGMVQIFHPPSRG